MKRYIATDDEGRIVAKYEKSSEPNIPDSFALEEVDSFENVDTERGVSWFP